METAINILASVICLGVGVVMILNWYAARKFKRAIEAFDEQAKLARTQVQGQWASLKKK